MMNPIDVFILAHTKLRTHKLRTGITVTASGLLFGLIVASIMVTQGVFNSVDDYSKVGLNDRSVLTIAHYPQSLYNSYEHRDDQTFIKEVEAARDAYVKNKQAIAKKYNVPYEPKYEDPSPVEVDKATGSKTISDDGLQNQFVNEVVARHNESKLNEFSIDEFLKPYKTATKRGKFIASQPTDGYLTYMKNGDENTQTSSNPFEDQMTGMGSGASLTLLDESLSEPFIANTKFDPSKGEIPVIMPYSDAQKLLKLKKLPADSSPKEQRERLKYVRDHIGDVTASFCYRNAASRALMGLATQQRDEIKRSKDNANYIKPSVIYNDFDDKSCDAVTVKSDTRTAEEKKAEANQIAYQKELGTWLGEPKQQKLTVRGVGISGDSDLGMASMSIKTLISSLLNSSLGYGTWVVPTGLFDKLPAESKPDEVFKPAEPTTKSNRDIFFNDRQYLVEFGDKDEARAVLKRTGMTSGNPTDTFAVPFGSGTLVVDEARSFANTVLFWALVVVGAIAALILVGIIGRTVSDSRRESAVFRAIGAQRLDIAGIYGFYVLLLALRIVIFAFVLGLVCALVLDYLLSPDATVSAQLAYAAVDTNIEFHLFGLNSWYLPIVIAVVIGSGLVASIIPILLGARRNPINDMRDDG